MNSCFSFYHSKYGGCLYTRCYILTLLKIPRLMTESNSKLFTILRQVSDKSFPKLKVFFILIMAPLFIIFSLDHENTRIGTRVFALLFKSCLRSSVRKPWTQVKCIVILSSLIPHALFPLPYVRLATTKHILRPHHINSTEFASPSTVWVRESNTPSVPLSVSCGFGGEGHENWVLHPGEVKLYDFINSLSSQNLI